MAKRGRKPKPTALKKLEGNPGKRPLNELEPMPAITMLRCPNWLESEARKEWRRLAPLLISAGILTAADAVTFAGYCQAYARWREAEEQISKLGMIYKDKVTGKIHPNPYIAISRAAFTEVKSMAAEFGLTPATRTAIIANAMSIAKDRKALDPMEQILSSNSLDDEIVITTDEEGADDGDPS